MENKRSGKALDVGGGKKYEADGRGDRTTRLSANVDLID
jgi:hypothetical protein